VVLLPSATMPRFVTLYGVAAVCAKPGATAAVKISVAQMKICIIAQR